MASILGGQQPPRSILGGLRGYSPIRQIAAPQGQPMQPQASPFGMMGAGQGGASDGYGSDAWALATGGPGAAILRELARGGPYQALDPKTRVFSPDLLKYLGPQFQRKGK